MIIKKRLFSLLSAVMTVSLLLSGCMAELVDTTIHKDGSGKIVIEVGMSEEAIKSMDSEFADGDSSSSLDTAYEFEYNGTKYFGEKEEFEFSNLQELSEYLNTESDNMDDFEDSTDSTSSDSNSNFFKAYQESTGEFVLEFVADKVDTDSLTVSDMEVEELEPEQISSMTPEQVEELRIQAEAAQAMLSGIVIKITFNMPAPVYQVEGPSVGIDINNNVLIMDIMALSSYITDETKIVFKTDPIDDLTAYRAGEEQKNGTAYIDLASETDKVEAELSGHTDELIDTPVVLLDEPEIVEAVEVETKFTGHFKDVANDAWYFQAIEALADGGLIHGFQDGTYRPDEKITYAQLCTIIANGKRLTYGDSVGYWAYDSIYACISRNYLPDLSGKKAKGQPFDEAITPELYDVPVTRAWGVTTLVKASKSKLEDIVTQHGKIDTVIPDIDKISGDFVEYIKLAYAAGMIAGMDENHTFGPDVYMTRGQVAQILYNMGWINSI